MDIHSRFVFVEKAARGLLAGWFFDLSMILSENRSPLFRIML